MINKEYIFREGVYEVQTFRTTQAGFCAPKSDLA